ncbi:MAG: bifunctional rhamnulose-1-phosphate aldolase/short-chain dehydrogenase [Planctomycetes bacterium]|nr:bifunctional rhamnulose-1-phosphate aldolase/short-chain dehydrogenase [Planctomycetota bacterium]NOG54490.1 bifunctional rhamnulose-1-phosphate aldolase/short-chain dehydrogenase [Planctomycetota bacterium]
MVGAAWDAGQAQTLNPLDRLVYRSNLLGSDRRITNTGGGNTSSKMTQTDPVTGSPVDVLMVKGSGGDLRTAGSDHFCCLSLQRVQALEKRYLSSDPHGLKTPAEDEMVSLYPLCAVGTGTRAPSIDTPLHAFIPHRHVDHVHPDSVVAIAASKRGRQLTTEVFGDDVFWLDWQRPGFDLGLKLRNAIASHPQSKGAVLGGHGLICWADDDQECYELTIDLVNRAADYIESHDLGDLAFGAPRFTDLPEQQRNETLVTLLPWLRGKMADCGRLVATVETGDRIRQFVNSRDAARLAALGTSCPDHFLRTKIKPLYIDWDAGNERPETLQEKILSGLAQYQKDYRSYYERCCSPDSPPVRPTYPTVILIPGIGMIAWGKNKSESRVTAEFYRCAVEVMRGAEAIDEYVALSEQEAFDIEYWALEEAKLRRMPPEHPMARRVCVVVGAGSGIGQAVAARLAHEGAHIVAADRDHVAAQQTADSITEARGEGIGVAGTGVSACGPAIAHQVDITDRQAITGLLQQTVLAYGGIDDVIITAGVYESPDEFGHNTDQQWERSLGINVLGTYKVIDTVRSVWDSQELNGAAVVATSVNGLIAKRGSLAYDASKAAVTHLVRELAVELAPMVRVNGVAPAAVVNGSAMFPRDRVIASLTKYGLDHADDETDEALRDRLAQFYAKRTLLKQPVTPGDQAEAILFLVSDRARNTTGQILVVDGGLPEAFVR